MSGASGSGGSGGVVRNSALSFIQDAQESAGNNPQDREMSQTERLVPAGLKALCDTYSKLYPDQPNPLQVTTRLKYWLGGQDPLDYISMYWNPGKPEEHIPPHWHYVSFGLSDLHGDGRVHPPPDRVLVAAGASAASGAGLELTFRLEAPPAPAPPPLWPAALLQALARYLLTTGNRFCAGDHISWHAALDGGTESRVRHLLVAEDPQLTPIDTPHGTVSFLQMVGCTGRELRAAQRGSGFDVLKLIAEDPKCGGSWLVTRVRRRASARRVRARSAGAAPAHLAGVSAALRWEPAALAAPVGARALAAPTVEEPASPSNLSPSVEQQIKDTLQRGLSSMSTDRTGPEGHTGMSTDSFEMSSIERALPQIPEQMQGSFRGEDAVEYLDGVHLMLNPEGASLLPLAIDGRVRHGRHFTWRCGPRAVTLVAAEVRGALVTPHAPYAATAAGTWLQVLIPNDLAEDMSAQVAPLAALMDSDSEASSGEDSERPPPAPAAPAPRPPFVLSWPRHRLRLTVLPDHMLL